jgi:hypothetical protein
MNLFKPFRGIGMLIAILGLLVVGTVVSAEDAKPSGTLHMEETEVGLLIGGDWGKGTLTYNGSEYPFKATGAKLGGAGITEAKVHGDVYNLADVEDFYGLYFKAEAGITADKGREGSWIKNDKGVTLHLTSDSEGLALSIGVEGLEISK